MGLVVQCKKCGKEFEIPLLPGTMINEKVCRTCQAEADQERVYGSDRKEKDH